MKLRTSSLVSNGSSKQRKRSTVEEISGRYFEVNGNMSETGTDTANCLRSAKEEAHSARRLGGYGK